jgi:FkbM family methyltransferase
MFVEYPICNVFRNMDYLLKRRGMTDMIGCYIQGSWMLLFLDDGGITRDLFQFGIRERSSTWMMQKILKDKQVVVDIGANIGYYALIEAKAGALVYAIEPVPTNFKRLTHNAEINQYKNIKPYQLAIGDKNTILQMKLTDKSNLHHITDKKTDNTIDVEVLTLDTFLKDKKTPDIVRMDVEGYEYQIIKGMPKTLKKMKPGSWLFIEIHNIPNKQELFDILSEAGFVVKRKIKECKESPLFSYLTYRNKFRFNFPMSGVNEYFFQKEAN